MRVGMPGGGGTEARVQADEEDEEVWAHTIGEEVGLRGIFGGWGIAGGCTLFLLGRWRCGGCRG